MRSCRSVTSTPVNVSTCSRVVRHIDGNEDGPGRFALITGSDAQCSLTKAVNSGLVQADIVAVRYVRSTVRKRPCCAGRGQSAMMGFNPAHRQSSARALAGRNRCPARSGPADSAMVSITVHFDANSSIRLHDGGASRSVSSASGRWWLARRPALHGRPRSRCHWRRPAPATEGARLSRVAIGARVERRHDDAACASACTACAITIASARSEPTPGIR